VLDVWYFSGFKIFQAYYDKYVYFQYFHNPSSFLGVLANLLKLLFSFVMFVRLPVREEEFVTVWKNFRTVLYIGGFY
jgi:hypothetical protein